MVSPEATLASIASTEMSTVHAEVLILYMLPSAWSMPTIYPLSFGKQVIVFVINLHNRSTEWKRSFFYAFIFEKIP